MFLLMHSQIFFAREKMHLTEGVSYVQCIAHGYSVPAIRRFLVLLLSEGDGACVSELTHFLLRIAPPLRKREAFAYVFIFLFHIMNSLSKSVPETAADMTAKLSAPAPNSSTEVITALTSDVLTVRQFLEHIMPNSGRHIAIAGLALDARSRDAWITHAEQVRDRERAIFFDALRRMAHGRKLSLVEDL